MANLVKPTGKIYSFDVRKESHATAKSNLKLFGLEDFVNLEILDVTKEIPEMPLADVAVLDLANPWDALPNVIKILKSGGHVVVFIPTLSQIEKTISKMNEMNIFANVTIQECLERFYETKPNAIRPKTRMIGHTGYLIFARKKEMPSDDNHSTRKTNAKDVDIKSIPDA